MNACTSNRFDHRSPHSKRQIYINLLKIPYSLVQLTRHNRTKCNRSTRYTHSHFFLHMNANVHTHTQTPETKEKKTNFDRVTQWMHTAYIAYFELQHRHKGTNEKHSKRKRIGKNASVENREKKDINTKECNKKNYEGNVWCEYTFEWWWRWKN